ncbi:hypothetical protein SPLC1_S530430 [Arthrospira platensis C1]|nr:hypothetical protein SPLC1_S530430 [Arthrospira platensis C1]
MPIYRHPTDQVKISRRGRVDLLGDSVGDRSLMIMVPVWWCGK